MKKNLILLLFLFTGLTLFSQELKYDLAFEFTGKVDETLDSTFNIVAIFDTDPRSEIMGIELVSSNYDKSETQKKELMLSNIKGSKKKYTIILGETSENLSYLELYVIDKKGEKIKLEMKNENK